MDARNLAEILPRQAEKIGSRPAIRFKRDGRYQGINWTEYNNRAQACAAALVQAGIKLGERVGLLGENSLEWLLADMGILTAGAVTVSPHSSLSVRQVQYHLVDAGAVAVCVQAEQPKSVRSRRDAAGRRRGRLTRRRRRRTLPGTISWKGRRRLLNTNPSFCAGKRNASPTISRLSCTPPAPPANPRA